MAKINREEYEILKSLDEKWKWIARDLVGELYTFVKEPYKDDEFKHWSNDTCDWIMFKNNLFHFIQWEDKEPHNIAELIEEYEDSKEYKDSLVIEYFMDKAKEGEETEVKNIEWLKKKFDTLFNGKSILTVGRSVVDEILNQLDEPETLSSDWIDEHEKGVFMDGKGRKKNFVWVDDLQGLFVLKQGEVDQAYKDGYEKGKEHATKIIKPIIPRFVAEWIEFKKKSEIPYENVLQAIDELVNSSTSKAHDWVLKTSENKDAFARAWLDGYTIEEEQKYYVVKSEGLDGVHYYFTKFDDEMNGLFTLPNDKKGAYRFDDKEKAQAIANYTDSKVEELE